MALLVSQAGDIQLAEDALQNACLKAGQKWPSSGIPKVPEAWLYKVAKNALIDAQRQKRLHAQEHVLQAYHDIANSGQLVDELSQSIPDERLKLIFTCCHPALKAEAQVALTLRTLCGLSAREIARAYLLSETAMQQRLVRAKHKIRSAGIAYRIPESHQLDERLDSVLEVLYLIYNESYTAFEGQSLSRKDLANEAIRLARLLHQLMPNPRTAGLLALMLLHQARNPARSDTNKPYISLQDQDRGQWNQAQISEGRQLVLSALAEGKPDKYQLQAAISALHSEADSWEKTDWQQILLLYSRLYKLEPNPVIKLNGLVALGHSGRANEALLQLQELRHELSTYQPYHAAMADLHTAAGDDIVALAYFDTAIKLSKNSAERDFLNDRRQQCRERITPR